MKYVLYEHSSSSYKFQFKNNEEKRQENERKRQQQKHERQIQELNERCDANLR